MTRRDDVARRRGRNQDGRAHEPLISVTGGGVLVLGKVRRVYGVREAGGLMLPEGTGTLPYTRPRDAMGTGAETAVGPARMATVQASLQ